MRWGWAVLAVMLVAGCSEVRKSPEVRPEAPVPQSSSNAGELPKLKPETLRLLARRGIEPQATRPLNVSSSCSHKDDIGTVTKLELLVREAEVKTFDAQVSMKKYGTCRFNLKDFDQAAKMPQALLKARDGSGCSVRMWEQGEKVTVAFNSCPRYCEGDAFSYLWPIMVEAKSGRCF